MAHVMYVMDSRQLSLKYGCEAWNQLILEFQPVTVLSDRQVGMEGHATKRLEVMTVG